MKKLRHVTLCKRWQQLHEFWAQATKQQQNVHLGMYQWLRKYVGLRAEQLMSLQTRLTETEQAMENELQQLTTEHEMNIKRLQAKHDAEIERIRAG